MSVALQFDFKDYATAGIEAKVNAAAPGRAAAACRQPLETFWRNRLRSLGPNKRGWPSTRFFERAARSVTGTATNEGVVLRADHQGLRQRWRGGRISAVKARMLTIPISPVSYGKSAAEFPGLFLLRTQKGAYLVQPGETIGGRGRALGGNAKRRLKANLNFLFKLQASVDQEGNPAVVPSNDEFAEVALGALERQLR